MCWDQKNEEQSDSNFIISIIVPVVPLMHNSPQLLRPQAEGCFTKGMTLDQYMSSNVYLQPDSPSSPLAQEQNLYESSGNARMEGVRGKNSQYFIDEIDQESIEDSMDNERRDENPNPSKNQRTKETMIQNADLGQNPWRNRVSSISMNATAFFKSSTHDRNTFRIKHMSMSPYKKKSESPLQTGSITLYGSKFGQPPSKNPSKMPQLVTFYGKLNHNNEEATKKQSITHAFKKKQSRRSFQKKNQLQIHELIEFQTKIKSNYSHKNYLHQFKVEGVKDKLNQRKNKFC